MKKKTKIIITGVAVIIGIAIGAHMLGKKKTKIELGKLDYENFDPNTIENPIDDQEPKESNENEVNEDLENQQEEPKYEAKEEDLQAADKADFGQYPFKAFKKENAQLLKGPDADRFKDTLVENFDNLAKALTKAREEGQTGITQDVLDSMELYFNTDDTSKIADIVNDIMYEGKELRIDKNDIYLFMNDDGSFKTNKPVVAGIRCKCAGDEIVYYIQGLAIMTPEFEGMIPFAIVPAEAGASNVQ